MKNSIVNLLTEISLMLAVINSKVNEDFSRVIISRKRQSHFHVAIAVHCIARLLDILNVKKCISFLLMSNRQIKTFSFSRAIYSFFTSKFRRLMGVFKKPFEKWQRR